MVIKLILILWLAYTASTVWCPCASASGPLCAVSVHIQRFVYVAMQTVAAPPLLGLAWLANKAAIPSKRLTRTLHWLAYSSCEPEKLLDAGYYDGRPSYIYYYWGDHFPATTRCWYRLFVSDAPMWLPEDPNKPDDLLCDQLVLIKRAVCAVTGCAME